MVTSEGKSLTEIKLMVKNQAQPFLKVGLPQGASILSADVAGERVKPVQGPDGSRVPLLRPGFRPTDSYTVSFVFMHSGAPFAKKGGAELEPAEHGYSHQPAELGSVSAGAVQSQGFRWRRDCREPCTRTVPSR